MPRLTVIGASVFLAACMSEEEFRKEYAKAWCAAGFECFSDATVNNSFGNQGECELVLDNFFAVLSYCEYDPSQARGCLKEMEVGGCAMFGAGDFQSAHCDEVYPDCPLEPQ